MDIDQTIAITVRRAAQLTGVSRTKLYSEMALNLLPSFKIGRRRLIRLDDLRNWIDRYAELQSARFPGRGQAST